MIARGFFSHGITPVDGQLARGSRAIGPDAQHPWELPRAVRLLLTLLLTNPPRRNGPPRPEWMLPNGCVMAVLYRSR